MEISKQGRARAGAPTTMAPRTIESGRPLSPPPAAGFLFREEGVRDFVGSLWAWCPPRLKPRVELLAKINVGTADTPGVLSGQGGVSLLRIVRSAIERAKQGSVSLAEEGSRLRDLLLASIERHRGLDEASVQFLKDARDVLCEGASCPHRPVGRLAPRDAAPQK